MAALRACTRPDIARQLDLSRVVVPRVAAVLSARGMLATDFRFGVARTHIGDTKALDGGAVKRLFAEMEAEGVSRLRGSPGSRSGAGFDGPARMTRSVDMRYGEQVFESAVPLDGVDWQATHPLPQIGQRFHRRHEELYTYALQTRTRSSSNARVTVAGILSALPQEPICPRRRPPPLAPSGGSTSTTGSAPRSTISTRWHQRKPSPGRPSSSPRSRRCYWLRASAPRSLRWAGWISSSHTQVKTYLGLKGRIAYFWKIAGTHFSLYCFCTLSLTQDSNASEYCKESDWLVRSGNTHPANRKQKCS